MQTLEMQIVTDFPDLGLMHARGQACKTLLEDFQRQNAMPALVVVEYGGQQKILAVPEALAFFAQVQADSS